MLRYEDLKPSKTEIDGWGDIWAQYGKFDDDKFIHPETIVMGVKKRGYTKEQLKAKIEQYLNKHNTLDVELYFSPHYDMIMGWTNVESPEEI